MKDPMLDKQFLYELDQQRNKEIFARIISLTFQEYPIEQIEGRVTSGSINIDGTSAVRRSCNLSLVAQNLDINNFYWGVSNKFKLEIGVRNNINSDYPDIIWFKEGTYIIVSFNTSYQTNGYNISISGKDKMCLLNGEISGQLPSSIDFGNDEYIETTYQEVNVLNAAVFAQGTYYKYDQPNNTYIECAKDEFENGMQYYVKEMNRTLKPIPIITILREGVHTYAGEPYHNIIINDLDDAGLEQLEYRGDIPLYIWRNVNTNNFEQITFDEPKDENGNSIITFDNLVAPFNTEAQQISKEDKPDWYTVAKLEYGEAAGYRLTELVYPGELIANIGEVFTSILDKIKNMLGDFEYFYDIDGRFIFQRKKTYVYTSWNNLIKNEGEMYAQALAYSSQSMYTFEDNNLVTSFQNTPNIAELRNDYSVWGSRKGISGIDIPIHARFAIDVKPKHYVSIHDGTVYEAIQEKDDEETKKRKYDWRELIYQMARDYMQYHDEDYQKDDQGRAVMPFEQRVQLYNPWCRNGITGYEQYYTDMFSFWRDLYNPLGNHEKYYQYGEDHQYWLKTVIESPNTINFWLEFLDNGDLQQYNIPTIGDRLKTTNDTKIQALYYKEIPNIIYQTPEEDRNKFDYKPGYVYQNLTTLTQNYFSISTQGKSAKDLIDEQLYQYAYCSESISLTTLPVYYLEPNTRIHVHDERSKINGDYMVTRITLPLAYNGTMQMQATKAVQRFT